MDNQPTWGDGLNLDQLIEFLAARDPNKVVVRGFHNPHSYRGIYQDLAFEPATNVTVGAMLADARSALDKTYQGYKGGDYTMYGSVDVWVAEEGSGWGEKIGYTLMMYMVGEV